MTKKRIKPIATINRKAPEQDEDIGTIFPREILKARDLSMEGMGDQQAETIGNGDLEEILLFLHVRKSDDCKGGPSVGIGLPMGLHGGQFGRLMVEDLAAARIAQNRSGEVRRERP